MAAGVSPDPGVLNRLPRLRINGIMEGLRKELPSIAGIPVRRLDGHGDFDHILEVVRRFLRRTAPKRTLVAAVNDMCALAALRAFEEAGFGQLCTVIGQNAIHEARYELRRRPARAWSAQGLTSRSATVTN